jgi:hypothetical protein
MQPLDREVLESVWKRNETVPPKKPKKMLERPSVLCSNTGHRVCKQ